MYYNIVSKSLIRNKMKRLKIEEIVKDSICLHWLAYCYAVDNEQERDVLLD